jgi:hypothetical protein
MNGFMRDFRLAKLFIRQSRQTRGAAIILNAVRDAHVSELGARKRNVGIGAIDWRNDIHCWQRECGSGKSVTDSASP